MNSNKILKKIRDELLQQIQVLENRNADVSEIRNLTRGRKAHWKTTLGMSKGDFKDFWLKVQRAVYDSRQEARERESSRIAAIEKQQQISKVKAKASAFENPPRKLKRLHKNVTSGSKTPVSECAKPPSRKLKKVRRDPPTSPLRKHKKVRKAPSTTSSKHKKRRKIDNHGPWSKAINIGTTRFKFQWESVKKI